MTVKELYNYCKELGIENDEIEIDFECSDDYYDTNVVFDENDIDTKKNTVIIEIYG